MIKGYVERRQILEDIFRDSLAAVDPYEMTLSVLRGINVDGYRHIYVVGFGKAAFPMARAAESVLDRKIKTGLVITKEGHIPEGDHLRVIEALEASHPVPDERGLKATGRLTALVSRASRDDMVVVLTSGGGSALFVAPVDGVSLKEKQEVTSLLLNSGADIGELNTVRKHLSRVKGGRLAEIIYPAKLINLIVSDVIGDPLDVIASGPTVPDPTTFEDAVDVLKKYDLLKRVPGTVRYYLESGVRGEVKETPKSGSKVFKGVRNIIIGSNRKAIEGARRSARERGFNVMLLTDRLTGEAREAGRYLAEKAVEAKRNCDDLPLCMISGGETTVTVKGDGRGGRNTELALSFASYIDGMEGLTLLSAGTDGTDGPTDAAGAVVDGNTISRGREKGVNYREYLERNDSYSYFEITGELLKTGPTGTNVMDIQIILVE
ncbi:MAG: glycerate kinase [Nitrospirae bacterium]|nr:MAG: glycerate kinase [Nitrospirota bacterium]